MSARARRRPAVALGALALVPFTLLGAGCGDDDSGSTAADPADGGALSVTVEPAEAAPGEIVEARVDNATDETFTYGADYVLERRAGEEFEPVPLPPRPVPAIGYIAEPGGSGPPVRVRVPEDAEPGEYRVVIQRDVPDVGDLSGDFDVSGDD